MTKLLNRGNVFVVMRHTLGWGGISDGTSLGVFSELDEADDYKGMCEQQWRDKVGHLHEVEFSIQMTTYYGK
jgi:hypothetical protein